MAALTKRQAETLRFIQGFIETKGYSPCLREICDGIGARQKSGAHRLVTGLEERGAIRRLPNRDRAIEVIDPLPIARAPDGAPLRAVAIGGAR